MGRFPRRRPVITMKTFPLRRQYQTPGARLAFRVQADPPILTTTSASAELARASLNLPTALHSRIQESQAETMIRMLGIPK